MKNSSIELDAPEAVCGIARRLEEHGYETWAVGGAVRDALLGGERSDWDLATAARPETIRKLFRPSYPIGIRFGTVGVRGSDGRVYEVTTFRRDIETDGRHAVVEYADRIDEDLARRDFTINAIAYHPLRHEVLDPHGGRADLERGVLRCVGAAALRFAEDYLRVLRGLRFAGRYGLEIETATWDALVAAVPGLPRLSGERIREELLKVLAAPAAAPGLRLYRRSGALAEVFPEIAGLTDADWELLLRAIDEIPAERLELRLSLLFEPAGPELETMMTRLRFSKAEIRSVTSLAHGLAAPLPDPGDVVGARRWLRDVGPETANGVLRLHAARAGGRDTRQEERARLEAQAELIHEVMGRGDPVTVADLSIDGNDLKALGLEPGPAFRNILEACLEAVIEDPDLNRREMLLERARALLERR